MNGKTAAQFFCNKFYVTPKGKDQEFVKEMLRIVSKEKPDIILPASSDEIYQLSFHRTDFEKLGAKVMVSELETCEIALNKVKSYERLEGIIPLPEYFYSHCGFVAKPMEGKGGRGVLMVNEPNSFLMEKLEGEQLDVDVLSFKEDVLLAMCKTRERAYGGTLVEGEIVNRPDIVEQIRKIIKVIPLQHLSVIQFINGKLLEINPRIAGMIFYPPSWNMPYLAIKLVLGEITANEVKNYQDKIPYGRRVSRYLSQLEY